MAPRIISWSDKEISISPILKSQGPPTHNFGLATLDESFVRHDTYYFKDGNVTFLIDGTLYCVHRYFFDHHSIYFSTRFAQLGIRDHEALPIVISIGDVKRNDFEALLSVLYPKDFEAHELSYEQWKSVLDLSTRWGFASLRKLALKSIKPPTSHDQLVLARTYSVEQWVLPALTALCSRALPLSLDEARQMDIEDVILVAAVREEIRGTALRVDAADIPQHVEMAQANNRLVSKVYGSTGKESGSTSDPMSKSVDASTLDLFGGSLNPNSASGLTTPAESGESQLPPMDEALQTKKLEGYPSEDAHPRVQLTAMTDVPGEVPDGHLAFPIRGTDSTNVSAPVTLVAEGAWGSPVWTKNKGPPTAAPVINRAWYSTAWVEMNGESQPVRAKNGGAGASTPGVPSTLGGEFFKRIT